MKDRHTIIIETTIGNDVKIKAHYSKIVNEATIKIVYKNKPSLKWTTSFTQDVDYETFKAFCMKFTFNSEFTVDDIIEFFREKM